MSLGMTKIYKFQDDVSTDALKELEKHSSLAVDTEGSGLQIPHRDKLSLVQFSAGIMRLTLYNRTEKIIKLLIS